MGIEYPILIFERDDQSAFVFSSEDDFQSWIEKPDVDNAEYLAWDRYGKALHLFTEKDTIIIKHAKDGKTLQDFLKRYATSKDLKQFSPDLELILFVFDLSK